MNDIFSLIKQGDESAFEQMFREHYQALCAFANSYLLDLDNAEEIVQNVFYKIWERRETLEINTSIKSYLFSSVRNACLNELKHDKVKQEHEGFVKATQSEGKEDGLLEQKELGYEINEAIESLPERCKEVFKLNRLEGLKYREVAELLNISEKTVEHQMGKALKVLREKLVHYVSIMIPWMIYFLNSIGGNAI